MNLSAIIILGPGQLPDGTMFPMGKSRIDVAHQKFLNAGSQPYIILSGGRKSHPASEASAMRDFIQTHYPDMLDKLLLEELSMDTLQNAFFTKVIHIDPLEIKQLTIVTNSYHMPRAKQIFTHLFNDSYHLQFLEAADPEVDDKTATNQKIIQKLAMEFNEQVLFCSDTSTNLKVVHSLIFNLDSHSVLAYKDLITSLQQYISW
jgi:vancomycin permeability regulator SanA